MFSDFSSFPSIDLTDECDVIYAVQVENVTFGYNQQSSVLRNFRVGIEQGKIFALLGSNGCGKTTLLKLILGRIKCEKGFIRVFGLEPGQKGSDIPGPGVGYMPQEIALFNDLTIRECLNYFGNIYKMNSIIIEHRIENLIDLLNLPKKDRLISELSGGQQRLVSMAVAIIHRPKLLILDEPTVGVDSILRCRIWQYLENICQKYGITVLITTHYIEEAKNASTVGFLSRGSLLRQSKPSLLMSEYKCESLEEVFLNICQQYYRQIREERNKGPIKKVEIVGETPKVLTINTITNTTNASVSLQRITALLKKNFICLSRSPISMILFYILPLITISMFKVTVGSKPINVPIAVYTGDEYETKQLSEHLLKSITHTINDTLIRVNYYPTKQSAIESVVMGKNMYALTFPHNYSINLKARLPDQFGVDDQVLNSSIIRVYADHSDSITAVYVRYLYFVDGMVEYIREMALKLNLNPRAFSLPLDTSRPIFQGSFYDSETYPSAGILFLVCYVFAMILSAFFLIIDTKNKSLERMYVSGVKPIEVLLVQMIEMFILISIQVLPAIFLTYYIFDIPINGTISQVFLLLLMQGLEGAGTGLLFALVFKNEVYVFILLVGLVIPLLLVSGVIWPSEAIPLYFRLVTDWTPVTLPLDSLRSMLFRRLTLFDTRVITGFVVCICYNAFILFTNILMVTYLKDFDFFNFFHLKHF